MEKITNSWELCIACGSTCNSEGDTYCGECGFELDRMNDFNL